MKIGLFVKESVIDERTLKSLIDSISSFDFEYDNTNPDVVFTIGGDGTFLKAVQNYLPRINEIKFFCINKGNLGFFSDFGLEEFKDVLSNLDNYDYSTHKLIETHVGDEVLYSVNEVRIESPVHTMIIEIYIDNVLLETMRGNGVVVSSSNGSTAYNKSIGGAIVDNKVDTLQLKEVAPISNRLFSSLGSPLVLFDPSQIMIKGNFSSSYISYDHLFVKDQNVNQILIKLSDKKVTIAHKKGYSHIKKISDTFTQK